MNIAPSSQPMRPKAPSILLAILCGVAVVALTQCKMTGDKVTGVQVTEGNRLTNRGDCVSNCAHEANDAMDAEKDLHKANVDRCHGDPACLDTENSRHTAAVQAIQDQRKHCMDRCHQQGGGHGN